LSVGIKNSGSVDAYLPLLKIFYESLDEKSDEIEGFYAAENWQDYTIKVHALKSSARIIGAVSFGEEAQLLENAGKSGDLAYIHEHHTGFMEKCRSFKAPLAEVFAAAQEEDKQVEDKPEADADLLAAVYEEIRTAAEDMDCDRLEDIFTEMEEYSMPAQEKEKWKQLKSAAGQFAYDTIIQLLTK
jgi:HPt (histidine-containing phosphotransfer) domain-containing protein